MSRTPAFVLLIWRPAALLLLLALSLFLGAAAIGTTGNGADWPELYVDLWRAAIFLPAGASAFLSLLLRELEHTTFAWMLPGLQRSLRNGKIVAGAALAAIIAVLVARIAPAPVAVGAGTLALACFALGGVAFDPVLPKTQTWPVLVLLIAGAYKPLYVEGPIASDPILLSPLLLLVSALLLEREFSRGLVRKRALSYAASVLIAAPSNTRRYWAQYHARDAEWRGNLARYDLIAWIRAGAYESYGGAKLGYFTHLVSIIVITVTVAAWTENPSMVVMMFWIFVGMMGIQLSHTFLYPLDRRQRARVFFLGSIAQSVATTLAAFTAILALNVLGMTASDNFSSGSFANLLTLLAIGLAWSPIVHWPKMRGAYLAAAASPGFALRHLMCMAVFIILTTISHIALTEGFELSRTYIWMLVAVIAAATHSALGVAVQRHFTRNDLVAAQ